MDTIPLFLQLVKAHALLYAVITTNDISLIENNYNGRYDYPSERGVTLFDFHLTNEDCFTSVNILVSEDSTLSIFMHTDSSKYYDNAPSYFGEETIYTPIENLLKEKNIEIPNKYKYEFSQFTPPAFVFVKPNLTEYAIVLRFGDEVCKKPFQITTDPNENDEKN